MEQCILKITGQFASQQNAIESATGRAYALDCGYNGVKRFITVGCAHREAKHICGQEQIFDFFVSHDRHCYEILLDKERTRLYLDLDRPWKDGPVDIAAILSGIREFATKKNEYLFKRVLVATSTRDGEKYSHHVVFPDAMFPSVKNEMKVFVACFVEWMRSMRPKDCRFINKRGEDVSDVDTKVYTTNRNFRMIGQSKLGDHTRTPLVFNTDLSSVDTRPSDSMLQGEWVDMEYKDNLSKCGDMFSSLDLPDSLEIFRGEKWKVVLVKKKKNTTLITERKSEQQHQHQQHQPQQHKQMSSILSFEHRLVLLDQSHEELIIENDRQIADELDARALRRIGYCEAFLPVLASLSTSKELTDDYLRAWVDLSNEAKAQRAVESAKGKSRDTTTCSHAMKYIRKHLGKTVVDRRPGDQRTVFHDADVNFQYPTKSNGWTIVESGDDLRKYLQNVAQQDNKFVGTPNERRRVTYTTGRMGIGKTKAIAQYAVDALHRGKVKTVAYLAPRRLLVEKTANMIRSMSTTRVDHSFLTKAYFYNSDDKVAEAERRRGNNNLKCIPRSFTCACINSINYVPEDAEILILDEMVMCVGNMFIEWSQKVQRGATGDQIDIEKDVLCIQRVIQRMRNAHSVVLIEAAMTPKLVAAYEAMWNWPDRVEDVLSNIEKSGIPNFLPKTNVDGPKTMKEWRVWLRRKRAYIKDGKPKYDSQQNKTAIQMDPIHLMIVPSVPPQYPPIFTKLEEYDTFKLLRNEMLHVVNRLDKKVVVYTSSTITAHSIASSVPGTHSNMQQAGCTATHSNDNSAVPKVILICSDTMAFKNKRDEVQHWTDNSRVAITTSVLGAGFSIEKLHAFDEAYLFLEMTKGTPPLADMVQLTARIRSITSGTLKFSVKSHAFGRDYKEEDEALEAKRKILAKVDEGLEKLHQYHSSQYVAHRTQAADECYAKLSAREALTCAYSTYDRLKDEYEKPEHVYGRVRHTDKGHEYAIRTNRRMICALSNAEETCALVVGKIGVRGRTSNNFNCKSDMVVASAVKRKLAQCHGTMKNTKDGDGVCDGCSVPVPEKRQRKCDTTNQAGDMEEDLSISYNASCDDDDEDEEECQITSELCDSECGED